MKEAYPVIFIKDDPGYSVSIPDFSLHTQGFSLAEAIEMARDAIGSVGIMMEDEGTPLPAASSLESISCDSSSFVSLVDIDFAEYRRQNDLRTVKKNCTLPSWLCTAAEKEHLNFSQILQEGLKSRLGYT